MKQMNKVKQRYFLFWLTLLLVALGFLTGCAKPFPDGGAEMGDTTAETASKETGPHQGGVMLVAMAADSIVTLDPAAHSDRATETVIRNIFDGLVTRAADNRIILELAEDYRWLDDRSVEFSLKRGVKFHNGDELTAEDVVFSFERILFQKVGSPRQAFVSQVESVEAIDDYTVRFNLKSHWPVFFQMLAHIQITPGDYLLQVGDEAFARHPVGSGPFKFIEGELDEQIVLERFDDYYGGADELPPVGPPALDKVIFRMMPDPLRRISALQSGEAQIIQDLSPRAAPQLIDNPDIIIKSAVGTRPKFMDLNVTRPPFDDARARRALNYAVDADALLDKIAAGYGIILPGPLSPANFYADPSLEPYGYRPKKARALLAEAGYAPEDIAFTIDAYGPYLDIATAVAGQLQQLGIVATVRSWEYNKVKPRLLDCERQAFLRDWGDSAFDPVGYLEAKWHTRVEGTPAGRGNFSCYSNAKVDALIEAGASEAAPRERQLIYNKAQRLIYQDAPAVFLYVPQEIDAASADVQNWNPSPDGRINLHDVWLAGE
ncbi:MAG TPA: ABC transporter substrate-binding protein [Chloroflexi bacterium]|nr:ABC transporter substrate-binding protein [Chloroflexota bacterium]